APDRPVGTDREPAGHLGFFDEQGPRARVGSGDRRDTAAKTEARDDDVEGLVEQFHGRGATTVAWRMTWQQPLIDRLPRAPQRPGLAAPPRQLQAPARGL